jgi:hypothetical protein
VTFGSYSFHGVEDWSVTSATANITVKLLFNFLFVWVGVIVEVAVHVHDETLAKQLDRLIWRKNKSILPGEQKPH